jgi:YfiH family protein
MSRQPLAWLTPDWPVPAAVRACATLRGGGVSEGAYTSLNLASHVGDRDEYVAENRRRLRAGLDLPGDPMWLTQVHGAAVARHEQGPRAEPADAAVAFDPGRVCAVLTADCLPVVLADRAATRVGVAHAGWRGLAAGVSSPRSRRSLPASSLAAWLRPAISPAFEVAARSATRSSRGRRDTPGRSRRTRVEIPGRPVSARRLTLEQAGVSAIYGGGWCLRRARRFFSYRRTVNDRMLRSPGLHDPRANGASALPALSGCRQCFRSLLFTALGEC